MRSPRLLVAFTIASFAAALVLTRPSPAAEQKRTRPWVQAKGIAVYPLGTNTLPATRDQFIAAFTKAWQENLLTANDNGHHLLTIEGDHYPALDRLKIDLSNSALDPDKPEPKLKGPDKVLQSINVNNLQFIARPMHYRGAQFNFDVAMTDARFDLQHDKSDHPVLVLNAVKDGRLDFSITKTDLDTLLFNSAKAAGEKYNVDVRATHFKMTLQSRAITMDLKVDTKVGFVPASLHIKGRIDINDRLEGKLSKLSVDGDLALQPLITTVIRPGLEKYEGRSKQVLGFPYNAVKVKDLQLTYTDTFRAVAIFGS